MEIKITMNQEGQFNVNVSDGVSIFAAIGALEVAKNILMNGDINTTTEPESEIITDEEAVQ